MVQRLYSWFLTILAVPFLLAEKVGQALFEWDDDE